MDKLQGDPYDIVRVAVETCFGMVTAIEFRDLLKNNDPDSHLLDETVSEFPFWQVRARFSTEYDMWWESARSTGVNPHRTVLVLCMAGVHELPDTHAAFVDKMEALCALASDDVFWCKKKELIKSVFHPDDISGPIAQGVRDSLDQLRALLRGSQTFRERVTQEMQQLRAFVQYALKQNKR